MTHRRRFLTASAVGAMVAFAGIRTVSAQVRAVPVHDPVLNKNAFYINVPSNWKAEGTMIPGSSCFANPSPVYRTMSPDGLSGAYLLPRVDWAWNANPRYPAAKAPDCMPWQRMLAAKEFLTYMLGVLNVGFVQEEEAPDLAVLKKNAEQMNAKAQGQMVVHADSARFRVRYSVNGRDVEEWLSAAISCMDTFVAGPNLRSVTCSAWVRRFWAPLGKLTGMEKAFTDIHRSERFDPQWNQEWNELVIRRIRAMYQSQTNALLAQGRLAQSGRMQQHRAFMGAMQRGADLRRYRFQEGQYRKQHNSDDRVDYLLDCQRYADGSTSGNCGNRQTAP